MASLTILPPSDVHPYCCRVKYIPHSAGKVLAWSAASSMILHSTTPCFGNKSGQLPSVKSSYTQQNFAGLRNLYLIVIDLNGLG